MYAAGQSLVCRKVSLNYEQNGEIENMFKTIIINHKCNQNDLIQNITNHYATIKVQYYFNQSKKHVNGYMNTWIQDNIIMYLYILF